MSQINTDLEALKTARDNMKTALEGKGQTVTKDIRTYANAIANIPAGGGGDVKLFQSRASMIADTSEDEGTLGLIYYNNSFPIIENSVSSNINLVQNVTLSEAYTGSAVYSHFRDDDTNAYISFQFSKTMARFNIRPEGGSSITVSYTSSDGLNYTTSSSSAGINIDLGTNMTFASDYDPWVPQFSSFATGGGMKLEGIYEYKDEVDDEWYDMITSYNVDISNATCSTINQEVYLPKLTTLLELMQTDGIKNMIVLKVNNNYYVQILQNEHYMTCDVSNNNLIYHGHFYKYASLGDDLTTPPKYTVYSLDLEHQTYTLVGEFNYDLRCSYTADTSSVWAALPYLNGNILYKSMRNTFKYMDKYDSGTITTQYFNLDDFWYSHVSFLTWHPIKSQINLSNKNQLLPGITALGNNGIITGDNTIYNNLDATKVYEKYYGFTSSDIDLYTDINKYDTDLILLKNTNTDSSTFKNKTYPIKLKKYVTKSDIKAFSFERQKIKLDDTQIMTLLDDMDFATLSGETYFYASHKVFANDNCTTIGVWCTHLTDKMYIIDTVNKTIVTSFKCYDCNIVKNKLMYMKERFTSTSSDIYVYCYDLNTRTETKICELPIGSINRSSMSSPAFIVSPLKNYYYIRTVGWNSANTAMKQNITTIDVDTLTYTTMSEMSLNKSSGNGEGTCMIYTKNSFICGMSVSNSDNTANVYLIEVGFDNTSTVLSSSKVSNNIIHAPNARGFISGNTIHYIDTESGNETIVRKIEIGTNITCTNGNRISTDYTIGLRLNIVFTQSGDILFNNYQNTGLDAYKGLWNRITDMSIDSQNNSVFTIDNVHPLPTSGDYTYAYGEEVSLSLNMDYWKNASLDFSNNNYTKVTSNYGIIIGKDITTTPLEVSNNNEYDYTVINAMLDKNNSRVRLFTIQQKRGWETNANGSVDLIVNGDASVSSNTLIFNEEE